MHCFVSHLLISLILFSRAAGIWRCFCYYGYSIRRPKALSHTKRCASALKAYIFTWFSYQIWKWLMWQCIYNFRRFFSSIYLVNTNLAGLVCGRERGSQALRNCSEITWFGPKKRFRLGWRSHSAHLYIYYTWGPTAVLIPAWFKITTEYDGGQRRLNIMYQNMICFIGEWIRFCFKINSCNKYLVCQIFQFILCHSQINVTEKEFQMKSWMVA